MLLCLTYSDMLIVVLKVRRVVAGEEDYETVDRAGLKEMEMADGGEEAGKME
jgi:hypothetical protein